jgi:hypothetical protein
VFKLMHEVLMDERFTLAYESVCVRFRAKYQQIQKIPPFLNDLRAVVLFPIRDDDLLVVLGGAPASQEIIAPFSYDDLDAETRIVVRQAALRHLLVLELQGRCARGRPYGRGQRGWQREDPLEDGACARHVKGRCDQEQPTPAPRVGVHKTRERRVADRVEAPRLEQYARRCHAARD